MSFHRFYCPEPLPEEPSAAGGEAARDAQKASLWDRSITLDAEQTHHARRVLRLRIGDRIGVFDGRGTVGEAQISQWPDRGGAGAVVRLLEVSHVAPPRPCIEVATAMPKGPRSADLIQALSQVGADRLFPLRCRRAAVDPDGINTRRIERAAVEAAKQCRRAHLMSIETPTGLDELFERPHDLRLLAVAAPRAPIDLAPLIAEAQCVLILIGPEGGWTDDEQSQATAAGCRPWHFGPHVMRIETACTAACAIVRYAMRGPEPTTQ